MWCSCCSRSPFSTSCSRTDGLRAWTQAARRRHGGDHDSGAGAGLLLRAARRRPGLRAEDLLRARADGDRGAVRLGRGRCHGNPPPAHRRPLLGRPLLRGDPPVGDTWRRGARHRLDLGARLVGPLVGVGRARARLVPRRVPPLLRLLPASLLDRGPRSAGALLVGVRDRGRCIRAPQLRGGQAGRIVHAPARALPDGRRPARRDAADLSRLAAGHDAAVRDAVEARADLQARRSPAQAAAPAARGARARSSGLMPALPLDEAGKYVAGAYVVFFALVLVYVAIIGSKIARIARAVEALQGDPSGDTPRADQLVEDE